MKTAEACLYDEFNPDSQDCQTPREDLQLAITLNPSLNKILKAMEEYHNQFTTPSPITDEVIAWDELLLRFNNSDFIVENHPYEFVDYLKANFPKALSLQGERQDAEMIGFAEWMCFKNYDSFMGNKNEVRWIVSEIDNVPTKTTSELLAIYKSEKSNPW